MLKRKTDTSSSMLMFNTIFLGIGTGLVILAWFAQFDKPDFESLFQLETWTKADKLLAATLAVLLAGLFHSLVIIYPDHLSREKERRLASEKANRLENFAMRDGLTGIYNRAYFDAALTAYLEEFSKTKASFGLFLIDIDNFKNINDTLGHATGDAVLTKVASKIAELAREYDVVARVGGEEFAIIAPYAEGSSLHLIGERYRQNIENLNLEYEDEKIITTVSIGFASNQVMPTAMELYKAADLKLYEAKKTGKNRVAG